MEILNNIAQYSDYFGVAIGLVILIVSSFFLPARIRSHVLTAGLTLIVFRVYQIYTNGKKLEKADKDRDKLRDQHTDLKARLVSMQHETKKLGTRKQEIEKELITLQQQKQLLDKATDADIETKKALDQRTTELLNESKEVVDQRKSQLEALRAVAAFNRKLASN